MKLTPGLFVVYLLLTGRIRAAVVAGGTMLGTVGLGFALLPDESRAYWGGVFFKSSRIGSDVYYFGNQSLQALLGRLVLAKTARNRPGVDLRSAHAVHLPAVRR
ncbi:glycosyltransferase 87 family protein [Saccharothrix deserti]|uniref:glycosyltransferase 87 family protein n=1 Tax=Saccharothrix deserti TaxID=2593674 RepID=UPI00131B4E8D|nr:glycosyltransferase 87 family protein [Saccharothrix deserti]